MLGINSFLDLFYTQQKGILLMNQLQEYTLLSKTFFFFSLGLEAIFFFLVVGLFGLAFFRVFKKIKNPKFLKSEEQEIIIEEDDSNDEKDSNDPIYRFDREKNLKNKKHKDLKNDDSSQDEYVKKTYSKEDRFNQAQNQVTFAIPFLVSSILANNCFSVTSINLLMMVTTILLFLVFNVVKFGRKIKIFSVVFLIPAIGSFAPFFLFENNTYQ